MQNTLFDEELRLKKLNDGDYVTIKDLDYPPEVIMTRAEAEKDLTDFLFLQFGGDDYEKKCHQFFFCASFSRKLIMSSHLCSDSSVFLNFYETFAVFPPWVTG